MSRRPQAKKKRLELQEKEDTGIDSNEKEESTEIAVAKPFFSEETDEFYIKWSGPVLLGPFLIAIISLVVIFTGQLVLNTWKGKCGYDLSSFIGAAIAICYLFLLVYSWVFIGTVIVLDVPLLGKVTIAYPFKSLKWIMSFYAVLAFAAVIIFSYGTFMYNLSYFCANTAPLLYGYAGFLITLFWIGFTIACLFIIKIFFGSRIAKMIADATKELSREDVEIKLFNSKFKLYDITNEKKIPKDEFDSFIRDLGVFIPPEEKETLIRTLDPDDTDYLAYDLVLEWFKKLNESFDDISDDEDDIPTDKEELKLYLADKKKRDEKKRKKRMGK